MKFTRTILFISIMLFASALCYAQSAKVLVRNGNGSSSGSVMVDIKWYSSTLIYASGANIYRRQSGQTDWTKLNSTPIIIQRTIPAAVLQRDPDIDAFFSMATRLNSTRNNGFMLLNLFVKSFQSADFAKLIGIQWDDRTANWQTSYEYRVTLINGKTETELAVSPQLTTSTFTRARKVNEFTAAADSSKAKLNWKPDEDLYYGYNVYRSSAADTTTKKLNQNPIVLSQTAGSPPPSDALYQDIGLKEGDTYIYSVAGLDYFGDESAPSDKIRVVMPDITPPTSPDGLHLDAHEFHIHLHWEPVNATDVTGYNVYRSTKSDGPFQKVNGSILPPSEPDFNDFVPSAGFYYYYVASVDQANNEGKSLHELIEVKDVVPPKPPMNVVAKPDTGKIILSWEANTEPDLLGYQLYRSIEGKDSLFVLVNAIATKETTHTQVFAKNASNKFFFKVIAVDTSYNKSAASEVVAARMPDVVPPLKPMIVACSAGNGSAQIQWAQNPDADLAGYILLRRAGSSTENTRINSDLLQADVTRFVDSLTTPGLYYYQLQAVDQSNNLSELSDPYAIETSITDIYSFNELKATFNKRKKASLVSWVGKSRNPVNGFVVFRKTEQETIWIPLSGVIREEKFEDKGIKANTRYTYQVRAYTSSGDITRSQEVTLRSGTIK